MSARSRVRFEAMGWALFTLSAVFFTISSYRSGDTSALAGSVLFLVACFFFMRPLLARQAEAGR